MAITNQTRNNATLTNQAWGTDGGSSIPIGSSMGLLLSLTYASEVVVNAGTTPAITNQSRNNGVITNQSHNNA